MAELIMGLAEIGFVIDGGLIFPGSLIDFSLTLQHGAEVAVGFRVIGTTLQGFAKCGFGFGKTPPADHENTIVIMTLGQIWIDRDDGAVGSFRFFRLAGAGIKG